MDRKEIYARYRKKNRAKINAYSKIHYLENKEYHKKYALKNKEKIKKYNLVYNNKHKLKRRTLYLENRLIFLEKQKKYNLAVKVKRKEYNAKYYSENKLEIKKQKQKYCLKKYRTDVLFRLRSIVAGHIRVALKNKFNGKKGQKWEVLVGYTKDQLKNYLQTKFSSQMSWGNYGSFWEIDHIVPLDWFKTEEQLIKHGWALRNLQPLESTVNRQKSNYFVGNPKSNIGVIYL